MRKLIDRTNPALYLTFVDPDDKYEYNARYGSFKNLIDHVKVRREKIQKKEPIKDLEWLVDAFLAELPRNLKYSVEVGEAPPTHLKDYFVGGSLIATLVKYKCMGKSCSVSPELANKRAEVCAGCVYNTGHVRDMGVLEGFGRKLIGWLINPKDNTTMYDEALGQCTQCGCILKDKVHCKKDVVKDGLYPELVQILPKNEMKRVDGGVMTCWQLDETLMKE